MDPVILVVVGAGLLGLYLYAKKSKADAGGSVSGGGSASGRAGGGTASGSASGSVTIGGETYTGGASGTASGTATPVTVIDLPPVPSDLDPGATPATAVTSDQVGPGFSGFVRITTGDTLSKLASKASPLVGPAMSWHSIRDNPANLWCKSQTTSQEQSTYGLALYARYGHNVGVDCEQIAGYMAKRYASNTGYFPVIKVG